MSSVEDILSRIHVGKTFSCFEDVEDLVNQLTKVCYFPLKYVSRRTVESHNNKKGAKQIALKWRYQSTNILCSHYGTHRDRSTGVRPNQNVFVSGCKFGFRVSFESTIEMFIIQWANLEHSGHAISQELITTYRMKENLAPEALNFAERALLAGAVPDRVRTQLQLEFGSQVNSKFLKNIKQSVIGLPKDEWARACSMLKCYSETPGNVVKILHDESNVVTLMYVQLAQQRELYKKFGEMVQLDGTYNVNRLSMPLYTLLIEDNYGVGQPIAYFFVKDETRDSIMDGLNIFAQHNDVSKTTVVITDKDCREMTSVSSIFPSAKCLLCHFHALAAVDKRLDKAGLHVDHRDGLYNKFKEALYCKTNEELDYYQEELCNIEEDALGLYFTNNWFNCIELWAIQFRVNLFGMGNNTTNRLERLHSTIKKELQHRKVRFPELLQVLLDLTLLRMADRDYKAMLSSVRFRTNKIPPILSELIKVVTPYASKLVAEQYLLPTSSYVVIQDDLETGYRLKSNSNTYVIDEHLTCCTCPFFHGYRLPCRHILFICGQEKKGLLVERFNPRWRINTEEETEIDNNMQTTRSPVAVLRARKENRPVSREEMWCEANLRARSIANALSNMPLPAFRKYLLSMETFEEAIKQNKRFKIVFEGSFTTNASEDLLASTVPGPSQNTSANLLDSPVPGPSQNTSANLLDYPVPGPSQNISANLLHSPVPGPSQNTCDDWLDSPVPGPSQNTSANLLHSPVPGPSQNTSDDLPDSPVPGPSQNVSSSRKRKGTIRQANLARKKPQLYDLAGAVSVGTGSVGAGSVGEGSIQSGLEKLIDLQLPTVKQGVGRPRKTKKLDRYKYTPVPYSKKSKAEKERMFLRWVVGAEVANKALNDKISIEENDINPFPENVSSGITEEDVKTSEFEHLFTEEAWSAVVNLVQTKKNNPVYKCGNCTKTVNGTTQSVLCDSCLEWHHYKCEGIGKASEIKSKFFSCAACRARAKL